MPVYYSTRVNHWTSNNLRRLCKSSDDWNWLESQRSQHFTNCIVPKWFLVIEKPNHRFSVTKQCFASSYADHLYPLISWPSLNELLDHYELQVPAIVLDSIHDKIHTLSRTYRESCFSRIKPGWYQKQTPSFLADCPLLDIYCRFKRNALFDVWAAVSNKMRLHHLV